MKAFIPLLLIIIMGCQSQTGPRLVEQWSTQKVMKTPESILYVPEQDVLLVSNINGSPLEMDGNGFISKLSTTGEIRELEWITGLNAPKGMAYSGNTLYVTDINQLVEINMDSAKIVKRYTGENAVFLNDIAIDNDANVYVSDYSGENSALYRLSAGQFELWLSHPEVARPNGMLLQGGEILFGNTGDNKIKAVKLADKTIRTVVDAQMGADGLRALDKDAFLVSDWAGRTAIVKTDGTLIELLNTTDQNINSADIEYIPEKKMLFIPTFGDNRVVAYQLVR